MTSRRTFKTECHIATNKGCALEICAHILESGRYTFQAFGCIGPLFCMRRRSRGLTRAYQKKFFLRLFTKYCWPPAVQTCPLDSNT